MKINKTSKIVVFLLIALIAYGFSVVISPSKAQDEVVLVRMDPVSLTVNEGELFNITVHIDNVPTDQNFTGVQFKIAWDPTVLNAVNMTEVLFNSVTPPGEEGNIWQLSYTVAAGYVEYGYTWMDYTSAYELGYAPLSGNHTLAIITLNATTTGLTTLDFSVLKISGYDPETMWSIKYVDYPKKPLPENYSLIESPITVGNPPPTITIMSPQNTTYSETPVNLTFTLSEPEDWIGYSLDGQANKTITGNTTINISDGLHNLRIYANDTTGNMGSSLKIYFTVDTTSPVASFTYPPEELEAEMIFGTYKWEITFNASESHDLVTEVISYTWDFGDGFAGHGIVVTHLFREEGNYTVTLTVKDTANHTDAETVTITLTEPPPPAEPLSWGTIMFIATSIAILIVWAAVVGVYLLKTKRKT